MEARGRDDPTAKEALADLCDCVFTLGLKHEQPMFSDNVDSFSIASFPRELARNVAASFAVRAAGIKVAVASEPA